MNSLLSQGSYSWPAGNFSDARATDRPMIWSCDCCWLRKSEDGDIHDKINHVIILGGPAMSKSWSNLSVQTEELKQKHKRWRNNEWTEWPSTPEDATGGIKEIRVIKIESNVTIIMERCPSPNPAAVTEIDFYAHLEECLIAHGPIIATAICCCLYLYYPPLAPRMMELFSVWELELLVLECQRWIDGWMDRGRRSRNDLRWLLNYAVTKEGRRPIKSKRRNSDRNTFN